MATEGREANSRRSGICWRDAGKEDGGKGEGAHQERKPHRGKPRHGDEEQDIWIAERSGPSDGGPEAGVVNGVPEGEGPQENGGARPGLGRRNQSNAEEHEDGGGLAKEFEGEKALGKLAYRLGLLVEASRHADDVGECSLISGQQPRGGAEIDDNHSFQESEGRREHAGDEQLPRGKRDTATTPGEPGQQRNQNEEVYPPRLGNESDGHEDFTVSRGKFGERRE